MDAVVELRSTATHRARSGRCDPRRPGSVRVPRGGGGRRNTSPGWTRLRAPTPSNKARTRAAPPRATRINYRRAPPRPRDCCTAAAARRRAPRARGPGPQTTLSLSPLRHLTTHTSQTPIIHQVIPRPPISLSARPTLAPVPGRACGRRINVSLCVALFPPSPPPHRHLRNRRHFATTEIGLRCSPRSPRSSRRAPARRSFP